MRALTLLANVLRLKLRPLREEGDFARHNYSTYVLTVGEREYILNFSIILGRSNLREKGPLILYPAMLNVHLSTPNTFRSRPVRLGDFGERVKSFDTRDLGEFEREFSRWFRAATLAERLNNQVGSEA